MPTDDVKCYKKKAPPEFLTDPSQPTNVIMLIIYRLVCYTHIVIIIITVKLTSTVRLLSIKIPIG